MMALYRFVTNLANPLNTSFTTWQLIFPGNERRSKGH
jgi:hypothetical protein